MKLETGFHLVFALVLTSSPGSSVHQNYDLTNDELEGSQAESVEGIGRR